MHHFLWRLKQLLRRNRPSRLILAITILFATAYGTVGFRLLEGAAWGESFYWTVTTMSTVGYGDLSPQTGVGRVHAMLLMVMGVGIFGLVVEGLVSLILEYTERAKRGLITVKDQKHVVICGWTETLRESLLELLRLKKDVTVISDDLDIRDLLEQLDPAILFVKGDPTRWEDLQRTNVAEATLVLIDLPTDSESLDCLITLRRRTAARIVVEVERAENQDKFRAAGADEMTIPFVLSGRLMAQSHEKRFLARFVTEVVSTGMGMTLEEVVVDEGSALQGCSLSELSSGEHLPEAFVVAVGRGDDLLLDTRGELTVQKGDHLICLVNAGSAGDVGSSGRKAAAG